MLHSLYLLRFISYSSFFNNFVINLHVPDHKKVNPTPFTELKTDKCFYSIKFLKITTCIYIYFCKKNNDFFFDFFENYCYVIYIIFSKKYDFVLYFQKTIIFRFFFSINNPAFTTHPTYFYPILVGTRKIDYLPICRKKPVKRFAGRYISKPHRKKY